MADCYHLSSPPSLRISTAISGPSQTLSKPISQEDVISPGYQTKGRADGRNCDQVTFNHDEIREHRGNTDRSGISADSEAKDHQHCTEQLVDICSGNSVTSLLHSSGRPLETSWTAILPPSSGTRPSVFDVNYFCRSRRLFLPVHFLLLTPLLGHSCPVAGDIEF